MVKKLTGQTGQTEQTEAAEAVRSSAQQIWQAGLGAFAKAQQEGGRVFSKLVQEGENFQQRAEARAADVGATVSGTVSKIADGMGKQASGSWDKLEQVFEERVVRALAAIGVPTQAELAVLHEKIDQLSRQVATLLPAAAPARPARKPAVKAAGKATIKPSAKPSAKAARKPAAAKKA